METQNIFWFRRDLRIGDNHALFQALSSGLKVRLIFIFDTDILNKIEDKKDKRVSFIYYQLNKLNQDLKQYNSAIEIFYGQPLVIWKNIIKQYPIQAVYTNADYEPSALERDNNIRDFLNSQGISFFGFKDQVIFEKSEIVKSDGLPYTIFTPYSKVWKSKLNSEVLKPFPSESLLSQMIENNVEFPPIEKIGFSLNESMGDYSLKSIKSIVETYHLTRDFPSLSNGTTEMGVHLRFGTVSIRKMVSNALLLNETWLNELIWREFFMQILYHFPKVVHQCFKSQYESISWRNNEEEFDKWCEGKTGYPIVDAGMRQLNQTGFMHNRVRMIVASFLTKHLLIDWRWGEAYFAKKLMDYDLSANNGNWQWASGTGCDAAPYFRIFNPYEQSKKFDKDNLYVHHWLNSEDFLIPPIIEHSYARIRALEVYKKGLLAHNNP